MRRRLLYKFDTPKKRNSVFESVLFNMTCGKTTYIMVAVINRPEGVIISGILSRESGWCVLYMCKNIMFGPATTRNHKCRR